MIVYHDILRIYRAYTYIMYTQYIWFYQMV